jgi:HSP20 family protein
MSPQLSEAKEDQTMNYLTRHDPYRSLDSFQERLNQIFGGGLGRRDREEEMSLGAWMPPVDIEEDNEKIVLTAELPGMKENDIDIQMEGGVLTIRGERKFENEKEGKNYHRVERSYGQFVRSFTLPNNVDRENIQARFQDGLLRIELPKREEAKPRQIKIGGSDARRQNQSPETVNVQSR